VPIICLRRAIPTSARRVLSLVSRGHLGSDESDAQIAEFFVWHFGMALFRPRSGRSSRVLLVPNYHQIVIQNENYQRRQRNRQSLRVLVRFNHVARCIVNSNHSIMYAAVKRPDVLSEVTPEISQPERDCHLKSGLIRRSQFHYLLGPFLRARQNRG
jgi:hypothetical protein